ncbi:MAG: hypothetical protein HC913_08485 [Microscillaceae bacterium]|nr:hypothetical protein [Microscillaceae bacterium]
MVEIWLPDEFSDEFAARIPAQIEKVNELMLNRTISSYTLTADRSRLWTTLSAEDESGVQAILDEFPLIEWMDYEIHELMFHHESSAFIMPRFSLN